MRVALSYDRLSNIEETASLISDLRILCRDVYFINITENANRRSKIMKALRRNGIDVSDVIFCSENSIDYMLMKYHVDLYFPDTNVSPSEILHKTKEAIEKQEAKHAEHKRLIEKDIANGVRGVTPSQQKAWHKFLSEEQMVFNFPEMSTYDYLRLATGALSYKNALYYFGQHITFGQLFDNIELCAKAFWANGVKAGDTVVLAIPNIPESVYMIYALSKIGAIADIVDPRHSPSNINRAIKETNAKLFVLIDSDGSIQHLNDYIINTSIDAVITVTPADSLSPVLAFLYKARNRSTVPQTLARVLGYAQFITTGKKYDQPVAAEYKKDSTAIIVYTSGTTGKPKGIKLSHDAINASVSICAPFIEDMQPEDTFLGMMPVFMSFGIVNGMHYPLVMGQELILVPKWNEHEFPELLQKYKPNHVSSVPKCWSLVADSILFGKFSDFSFLKTPMSGADSLPEASHKRINAALQKAGCRYPLSNGYGASQVCAGIAAPTYDRASARYGASGIPIGNVIIAIMDFEGNAEMPYNTDGEIWICSPTTMLGYSGEERTNEFSEYDGHMWWHSGDIGHMDEDGHLFVVGRLKDAIATKTGTKISPSYISESILKISEYQGKRLERKIIDGLSKAILDCVVVGVPSEDKTLSYQVPVAHVVLSNESTGLMQEIPALLSDYIEEVIDSKHRPVSYYFYQDGELPLTPAKKIDIKALRKKGINPDIYFTW